jgi:predicted Zn-dependent peptidase
MDTSKKNSLPGPDDTYREVLSNGITLLTRSNFNSPSVVISGFFNAGAIFDPDEKLGLADFATSALMRTKKRSFDEITRRLNRSAPVLGSIRCINRFSRSLAEDLSATRLLSESRQPIFQKPKSKSCAHNSSRAISGAGYR